MSVSLTLAVPPTVLTASSCPMTTNVSASLDSQAGGVRAGLVSVSLSLVRAEASVLYPAALHWDTLARVSLVMLGPIVKEACPVGSCPATTEAAVHSPRGGRVAPACQVMVGPSVSIAAMKAALPSPVGMEGCALKRPASPSSTVSVPVAGQANGASRAADPLRTRHPPALWQTVRAKPRMVFATRNATHSFVNGTAVTVLWQ